MREIEIKVQVMDVAKLQAIMEKQGIKLTKPIKQHDVVYGVRKPDGSWVHGKQWFRLRTEDNIKQIFTMKRSLGKGLDSLEYETLVDDGQPVLEMLKDLGFEHYCTITKLRQKAKHAKFEICLDHVPELKGDYLEVELMVAVDAVREDVMAEIKEFLVTLGVDPSQEITEGYDVLLLRQQAQAY